MKKWKKTKKTKGLNIYKLVMKANADNSSQLFYNFGARYTKWLALSFESIYMNVKA